MRALFVTLIILLHLSPLHAQDLVTTVDGFPVTIQYLAKDRKVADKVSSIAEQEIPRLSGELGLETMGPVRVFLISDMDAFQKEQQIRLPSWGVAFALMDNQVMLVDVKRATHAMNTLEKVIPHELSHLLLAQRIKGVALPLWFVEGLAMWQAREWSLIENWRLMEAVWGHRAPGLHQIYTRLPREEPRARDAYRVAYTGFTERFDEQMDLLPGFLDEVVQREDFSNAFEAFWGEKEVDFYGRFAADLDRRYRSRLLLFQPGPLFTLMAIFFVIVIVTLYVRNRVKLRRMDDADHDLWHDER